MDSVVGSFLVQRGDLIGGSVLANGQILLSGSVLAAGSPNSVWISASSDSWSLCGSSLVT